MNEHQRQAYLSALGVENYMPRWRLAMAPEPQACVMPIYANTYSEPAEVVPADEQLVRQVAGDIQRSSMQSVSPTLIADVLRDFVEPQKVSTSVTRNLVSEIPKVVNELAPFALSVWRPKADVLVIDSRNPQLALPTELLLNNMLSATFGRRLISGPEEVLRWPMVESSAISRTAEDARNTLQVWLEVELEQRPINYLLLFGKNSAQYFLPQSESYDESLWQWLTLSAPSVSALTAPSLVELLQQPLLKRHLWQCLTRLCVTACA